MKILVNVGAWIKTHIIVSIVGIGIIGTAVATPIIIHNVNNNNKFEIEMNYLGAEPSIVHRTIDSL